MLLYLREGTETEQSLSNTVTIWKRHLTLIRYLIPLWLPDMPQLGLPRWKHTLFVDQKWVMQISNGQIYDQKVKGLC